jgi:hypothetical protein
MKQNQTIQLKKDLKRCKGAEERIRENYENLLRLTAADEEGKTISVLNEETLRCARDAIYSANVFAGRMSEVIRNHSPKEFAQRPFESLLLNPIYAVSVTEDSVLLRVPLAPYSVQRNAQRRRGAGEETPAYSGYFGRRRYSEVDALLNTVQSINLYGRKLLYILHVYNTKGCYRMAPDFDNYDVKDLIDVVMARFGGDNGANLVVLHDSTFDTKLTSATYIGVTELDSCRSVEELMGYFWQCFSLMTRNPA